MFLKFFLKKCDQALTLYLKSSVNLHNCFTEIDWNRHSVHFDLTSFLQFVHYLVKLSSDARKTAENYLVGSLYHVHDML